MGKGLAIIAVADKAAAGLRRGIMQGGVNGAAFAFEIKSLGRIRRSSHARHPFSGASQ